MVLVLNWSSNNFHLVFSKIFFFFANPGRDTQDLAKIIIIVAARELQCRMHPYFVVKECAVAPLAFDWTRSIVNLLEILWFRLPKPKLQEEVLRISIPGCKFQKCLPETRQSRRLLADYSSLLSVGHNVVVAYIQMTKLQIHLKNILLGK